MGRYAMDAHSESIADIEKIPIIRKLPLLLVLFKYCMHAICCARDK